MFYTLALWAGYTAEYRFSPRACASARGRGSPGQGRERIARSGIVCYFRRLRVQLP